MRLLLLITVILVASPPTSIDPSLPPGWNAVTSRSKSHCLGVGPDPFRAEADFDGDGHDDVARLLSRASDKHLGLWIWFAATPAPNLVLETGFVDGSGDYAIGAAVPGMYWPLAPPGALKLERAGIHLMRCESSDRLVFFDRNRLRSAWLSD